MSDFDKRFYLVTKDGSKRFAARIDGQFQIGKYREETFANLADFARAVIINGKGGRFSSANGVSKSILVYGARTRSVAAYWLDPSVAAEAGLASEGTLATSGQ
ncbi:hypothetical protein [Sphingosinicella humi]|uniref:Uncharacterized protein n=1 Tax=Allosphingosinicella humi TaxID=2068657 RepID=A0A2U2J5D5_9SPHN|nr:hypothetical protein [Sphingosinicella humi]PWG03527.1 hypothetical protein DF286_12070 [Sphingosinicella humi]